jgi:hypothetical protein
VASLVALYRLYETRKDTFNVPSLLRLLKRQKIVDETTLSELDAMGSDAKLLWAKVRILRNSVFGHRSIAYSIEEAFKEAGLTGDNLRDLIERTKQLLDVVSDVSVADSSETRGDIIRLLTDISRPNTT